MDHYYRFGKIDPPKPGAKYLTRKLQLQKAPEYRPISWEDLSPFLCRNLVDNTDVDKDVLRLHRSMVYNLKVEGIYLFDELVGYARYDANRLHLGQIFIAPTYRGLGLATQYIQHHNLQTLYVMPGNAAAINLYTSLGFKVVGELTTRLFMSRVPFAVMPA